MAEGFFQDCRKKTICEEVNLYINEKEKKIRLRPTIGSGRNCFLRG